MGLRRRLEIYVVYDSPSIIKYLKLMIGDVFITCFVYCYFDESIFLTLGGEKQKQLVKEIM